MLEKVPVIKAKFEMIKVVLGGKLSIEDLMYPKYLKILVDALENTYLQLNDEICESLVMCKDRITSYNVCYTKLLRKRFCCFLCCVCFFITCQVSIFLLSGHLIQN